MNGVTVNGTQRHDGGIRNAVKHAFWMALMSKELGKKTANELGDLHEKGEDKQPGQIPILSKMDNSNNTLGVEIGSNLPDDTPNSIILSKILDAGKNGKLTIVIYNSDGDPEATKINLSDKKYSKQVLMIEKLIKTMENNKLIQAISYLIFTLLICGCSKSYEEIEDIRFKNQIYQLINQADFLNKNEYTTFKMDTLTDFKWEKMYTFSNINKQKMNELLGFEWEYSLDMGIAQEYDIMVVFVNGRKVISSAYFNDDDTDGFVKKKFTIGSKYPFCLKSEAIFSVEKDYGQNGYSFVIYQPQYSEFHQRPNSTLKKKYIPFKY